MRTESFAPPLTVLVGPARYVFAPGRDVTVGYGKGCDVPLDRPGGPPFPAPRPDVVLRFAGSRWMAIDMSPNGIFGIFVDGHRVPTVNIRDGQAITIGDPRRGPRLIFHIGAPAGPPPSRPPGPPQRPPQRPPPPRPPQPQPVRPNQPVRQPPTERATQQMRVPPPPPPPPAAERPRPPGDEQPTSSVPAGGGSVTYRLPLEPGARTSGMTAYRLGLGVDERELLADVSFTARPGTLTAVVGPSAARNSALLTLLAGAREPSSGRITIDGHDVHAEPESMRGRIGIVTRDDPVHSRLTVERALGYAAELRLPPNTSPEHRRRVVDQVLDELELTPYRATRIDKLPPQARRCASMAIELVTRPTLLVVDEPGADLDEGQEAHVMAVLRRQADIGCVVVVAVNSATGLGRLDVCDQVLLLTAAGATAFAGPPKQIKSAFGTADWSEVLAQVSADPGGAHRAFRARQPALAAMARPEAAAPWPPAAGLGLERQLGLMVRRQVRLLLADRIYLLFLAVLPFALAGLTLLIPGDAGLDRPGAASRNTHEAVEILAALNFSAVIIGATLTIREIVRERRIFRRERAAGLSASAYLAGKLVVFSAAAAISAAVVTGIVLAVNGGPGHGAVLLGNADVELYVTVAATAIVSAVIGLALSASGNSLREVLLLLVPLILASVLFAGGLISLVGTKGYDQIAWLVPAQWGFAASASTVDLHRVDDLAADALTWTHYSGWWVFDMVILLIFGAAWAGFALYRLRRPR